MYQRIMVAIDSNLPPARCSTRASKWPVTSGRSCILCHALDDTILAQQFARVVLPEGISPIENSLVQRGYRIPHTGGRNCAWPGRRNGDSSGRFGDRARSGTTRQAAAEWRADLLILGLHASQAVQRLLGGSIAEQLARKAGVSLFLVRS